MGSIQRYRFARVILSVFVGVAALLAVFAGVQAQSTKTITEWAVPTPNAGAVHVTPTSGTVISFTEMTAGKIGSLNTSSNNFTEWTLAAGSKPHGVGILGASVVFAEESGSVATLASSNGTLTEWALPGTGASPVEVVAKITSTCSCVFFTDAGTNRIGMLNTGSNQITEWTVPTASAKLNGLSLSGTGVVWFGEGVGKIGSLNTTTNAISEFTLPVGAGGSSNPAQVQVTGQLVFFADVAANVIGRFNAHSNVVTEWTVPTVNSAPAGVQAVAKKLPVIFFDEMSGNNVGTLDTSTGGTNTTLSATTTTVTPTTSSVAPTTKTLTKKVTAVPPTVTMVTGVVTGGFTEFAIPTAASQPVGMGQLTSGAATFAEFAGNKIAQVQ